MVVKESESLIVSTAAYYYVLQQRSRPTYNTLLGSGAELNEPIMRPGSSQLPTIQQIKTRQRRDDIEVLPNGCVFHQWLILNTSVRSSQSVKRVVRKASNPFHNNHRGKHVHNTINFWKFV